MKDGHSLLVFPDAHVDDGLPVALETALSFGEYFKPDETVILGDFLNFDYISHFVEHDMIARENKRLFKDFQIANNVLDTIQKFTKSKVTYIIGNHERRLDVWVRQHAEVEGLISLKAQLDLKKRDIEIIPEGAIYHLGHARFTHGWYAIQYHAKRSVEYAGDNIFYGHTHDVQSYSKPNCEQQPTIGQSLGCLCELNPEYMRNKPSRWVNALGIFYFDKKGMFTYYVPIMINGQFIFAGKVFK